MIPVVLKSLVWTFLNFGAIQVVKYGDSSNWNIFTMSILMIPIGIINCAVCFHSFYRLRKINKEQMTYSLFGIGNSIYFFISWNNLQILSGAMVR